jgi:hypothetical protein
MHTKSSLLNKRSKVVVAILVCAFFAVYGSANAAVLQLTTNTSATTVGSDVTLSVILDSEGLAVNNSEAVIKFPADLFDVVSVNKINSIFTLWVEDPSFSNVTGTITYDGGLPTPGFIGSRGSILNIILRAKKVGQAEFSFESAAVRANDGLGTDLLRSSPSKLVLISKKDDVYVEPSVVQEPQSTSILKITSLTHPDQDVWYKDNNPKFEWKIPAGAGAMQTSIDVNSARLPNVTYDPPISEKLVKDVADGVFYFKARYNKDGVWSQAATYIIRIDKTAPQKKNVDFYYDEETKALNISADIKDETSGLDHYEIYINGLLNKTLPAGEFINGKYKLSINTPGENSIKLLAVDRAGNSVEALGAFRISNMTAPILVRIPKIISVYDDLIIRGIAPYPSSDINVFIKYGEEKPYIIKTRSDSMMNFTSTATSLREGIYDIWVESGELESNTVSKHSYTRATSKALLTIYGMTLVASQLIVLLIGLLGLGLMGAYYLGHIGVVSHRRWRTKDAVSSGRSVKVLNLVRRHLEKYLDALQNTRKSRILSKEEKAIKEDIEADLDEIDKEIAKQK